MFMHVNILLTSPAFRTIPFSSRCSIVSLKRGIFLMQILIYTFCNSTIDDVNTSFHHAGRNKVVEQ